MDYEWFFRSLLVVALSGAEIRIQASAAFSVHVTSSAYPPPPPIYFRLNPDAESILRRYEVSLDRREPLPTMAYFCLTVVTRNGGIDAAAATYRINRAVLRKMSELSSTRSDALTARKAVAAAQPLSGAEQSWLEEMVKTLIYRLSDTRDRSPNWTSAAENGMSMKRPVSGKHALRIHMACKADAEVPS